MSWQQIKHEEVKNNIILPIKARELMNVCKNKTWDPVLLRVLIIHVSLRAWGQWVQEKCLLWDHCQMFDLTCIYPPLESSENLMISGGIEGKICIDSATICGVHVVANIIDYLYKDFTEAQVFIAVLVWFLGLPRSQHNCICHFLV